MISTSKFSIMRSFLVLSCIFYFVLLCITAFAIIYSAYELKHVTIIKNATVNYCNQVVTPVNRYTESDMFIHSDLSHIH
jgi:hypothetical protein